MSAQAGGDRYLSLVNRGTTAKLAKRLGLPRPPLLSRFDPAQPLPTRPVVVLGDGKDADAVAHQLLEWDLDVRRTAPPNDRIHGVVLVLNDATNPGDLEAPMLALAGCLRAVAPGGRVVTLSRSTNDTDPPALAATRRGVEGALRSLAHELRGGATANGLVLGETVGVDAPSVVAGIRFFLSAKSAYVDGQPLTIDTSDGALPVDWARPLDGQVAVVTGAARGIGAAIARTLARDGATVVGLDVPAAGDALATVVNEIHGTALQLDVTSADAGQRILDHALGRHGRLDIVVHNAGILRDKLLVNMTEDRWRTVLAVNLQSQLSINEALLADSRFGDGEHGAQPRIVALASTSGIAGNRGQTNYAASKAGVIGMVASTAPLLAGRGGTINAVAPGFIETDMTAKIPAAPREVARRLSSLRQGGLPIDVAETVAFLTAPSALGIRGRVLRVCGQNLVGA